MQSSKNVWGGGKAPGFAGKSGVKGNLAVLLRNYTAPALVSPRAFSTRFSFPA